MKSLLIAATTLLLTTATYAGEAAKPAASTGDSPMVQAAKSTRRDGKKKIVITNESLKNSKGHITSTNLMRDIPPVPAPVTQTADTAATTTAPAAKAADSRKAQETPADAMRRLSAEQVEEGQLSEMDPADLEHQLDKASHTAQPAPAEPKKP